VRNLGRVGRSRLRSRLRSNNRDGVGIVGRGIGLESGSRVRLVAASGRERLEGRQDLRLGEGHGGRRRVDKGCTPGVIENIAGVIIVPEGIVGMD